MNLAEQRGWVIGQRFDLTEAQVEPGNRFHGMKIGRIQALYLERRPGTSNL